MDWTISVPEGTEIIRVELSGDHDTTAITSLLKEVSDKIREHPTWPLLFDDRGLDVSRVTPNEMLVSNSMFAESTLGTSVRRIAILVKSDAEYERAANWSRMAHTRSMTRLGVFRDETEAIEWLTSNA